MKTRVLLITVLAVLLLSSCTHKNKKLAEAATSIAETIENQIPERAVDEIQEEAGCYESPHISLNYSPDVLEVHETAVSNNGETYLITFTERGTNDGAFPRLDIMSVKMAGFSEVLTAESAEYDFGSEFRQFSEGILSAYYLPEGKLGSVNTALIEMCEPQIESDVEDLLCKTKASIAATNGLPAMNASVEMQCKGEDGIIMILLIPNDVSDAVVEELKSTKRSAIYS